MYGMIKSPSVLGKSPKSSSLNKDPDFSPQENKNERIEKDKRRNALKSSTMKEL